MTLPKSVAKKFYLGTFISATGSGTFFNSFLAFLLASGYDLSAAAQVLGWSRFIPVLVNIFFGELADRVSARKVVIVTEVFGCLCSLGLFLSWVQNLGLISVGIFATGHAVAMGLQSAARAKLSRMLSADDYESNKKHAVLLNIVSYGTVAFAGALGWLAVKYLSFPWVVTFDAFTFIINGYLIWSTPLDSKPSQTIAGYDVLGKLNLLFSCDKQTVWKDLALAFVMAGTNVFIARITSPNQELIPLFIMFFGIAVWLAGWLEQKEYIETHYRLIWSVLAVAYIAIVLATTKLPWYWVLPFCFIKDTCYWILFHRHSAMIRYTTNLENTSVVMAMRGGLTVGILCLGELIYGQISSSLDLTVEGFLRAIFCVTIVILVGNSTKDKAPS